MKRSNIIFDLDGTLADSAILTMAAFGKIAPAAGLSPPDPNHVRACIGYANPEFYLRVYPNEPAGLVLHVGSMVEQAESELLDQLKGRLLFNGCAELLKELNRLGAFAYIASTGSGEHVLPIINKTGIAQYFIGIFCGEPDKSEMINKIIGNRDREKFLMVGDMEKDSRAAHENGIFSVGACYGYCIREKGGFDGYIDAPADLLKFL